MTATRRRSLALLALAAAALAAGSAGAAEAPPGSAGAAPSLFRVLQQGKWGYVDASGKLVIPPQFERAEDFSGGVAAVQKGATFGYVDASGRMVLVPEQRPGYLHRKFVDGRAVVKVDGLEGAIDRAGKLVIPARYRSLGDFSEGHALACDAETCGWIDVDGRRVLGPVGMGGTALHGGVGTGWLSMGMGRKRAFLYRVGQGRFPEEYEDTGLFSEGLVAVRVGARWGYAGADGKPRIPVRFAWAGDFSGGLAPARADGPLCGYIDRTGAFAIAPRFRECRPFVDGLARVDLAASALEEPRVAFVDRTGKPVIVGDEADPPFDSALDFSGGLAAVGQGGPVFNVATEAPTGPLLGYIDRNGRYVWKPTR